MTSCKKMCVTRMVEGGRTKAYQSERGEGGGDGCTVHACMTKLYITHRQRSPRGGESRCSKCLGNLVHPKVRKKLLPQLIRHNVLLRVSTAAH